VLDLAQNVSISEQVRHNNEKITELEEQIAALRAENAKLEASRPALPTEVA
jgi:uncharacterized small protein (DUF1192 family)